MPPDLADRVHALLLADLSVGVEIDRTAVERLVRAEAPLLGPDETDAVIDRVLARVTGLGPLEPLLADPQVSEVMVNPGGRVWVERHGRLSATGLRVDPTIVEHLIERVVSPLGLRVDRSSPLVDARLPDGSRVNAVVAPLAIDGPCLTIRRFVANQIDLACVCPPGVADLLTWAVGARANIVVCGGAGAGKTTLLNALAGFIDPVVRVITIEDTAELRLPGDHVVRLEARPANADGVGEVSIRRLLRNALRMRPDRIVVGEVRGAEVIEMVHAMTTGHEGSLSTCHANGPADALRRLETMALMADLALPLDAVRDQLMSAVDLIVHVARRPDGSRVVADVDEVIEVPRPSGERTRPLVGASGLVALPSRRVRAPGWPASSAEWLTA